MSSPANSGNDGPYVSRGGLKLEAALASFGIDPTGRMCADFGSHVGGFVDCLLQHGAGHVFSVDTSYGVLAWKLRKDMRVTVLERTNAMHVELPEKVQLLTIDTGWTRQVAILPSAERNLAERGQVITLIKPQYEAGEQERDGGVVRTDVVDTVVTRTVESIESAGWSVVDTVDSPITGHGGNREILALLTRQ